MKLIKFTSVILLSIALIIPSASRAQQAFTKGDDVLNLGIGIGGHYGGYGGSYSSQSPSIGISYDHGMSWAAGDGTISMGGYFGYKSLSARDGAYPYGYDYSWIYIMLGVRSAYHYNLFDNEKLDAYGGLLLSYNIASFDDKTNYNYGAVHYSGSSSYLGLSIFLGSRYEFSDKWGGFAELGYGIAYFTIGGSMKF